MKKLLKQVVGIDVAQKELVLCLGRMYDDLITELYGNKTFSNSPEGFIKLAAWVDQSTDATVDVRYVLEATGVYHEPLSHFLHEQGRSVSIVLPNKISNYFRTLTVKTVTDKTASEAITRFGLERHLNSWKRPDSVFKKLKQLTRERDQLVQHRTMAKNQLHAEQAEAEPNKGSLARVKKQIAFFDKQEQEIRSEIEELVRCDEKANKAVELICSIPGIGMLTAITVLAETNGFELIGSKRQLTSYAGLDVREKQSGTSVKGKPRISKKGNKHLRKAMHLPALAAIRSNDRFKAVFARLVARHGIKMKAAVAVQRKLLELTFVLYKTGVQYNRDHFKKLESSLNATL